MPIFTVAPNTNVDGVVDAAINIRPITPEGKLRIRLPGEPTKVNVRRPVPEDEAGRVIDFKHPREHHLGKSKTRWEPRKPGDPNPPSPPKGAA